MRKDNESSGQEALAHHLGIANKDPNLSNWSQSLKRKENVNIINTPVFPTKASPELCEYWLKPPYGSNVPQRIKLCR